MLKVIAAGKVALHNEMPTAGKRKADLARMLNLTLMQIDQLLSHHKSRIEQIKNTLATLGKRLVVEIHEAT